MKYLSKTVAALLLISLNAFSQTSTREKQPQITILKHLNIVDVEKREILHDMDIVIEKGTIRNIEKGVVPTGDERVIDLAGRYAIPGLIDAHAHLSHGQPRKDICEQLEYLVKHGVTSIRDVGGDARQLAEAKMAVNTGQIQGPDLYYSAFLATMEYYGGGAQRSWIRGLEDAEFAPWVQLVNPGDDLKTVMTAAKATGATGVKIYLGYDKEFLKELSEAARNAGLEVWAHAMLFPAKPSEVAAAGVKVLSHAYMLEWETVENPGKSFREAEAQMQRDQLDGMTINLDRFIAAALENDIILDATLLVSEQMKGYSHAIGITRRLHQAGVKISAGTDWFNFTHDPLPALYTEIGILVNQCGFSNMEALRAATIIAAETFNGQHKKGSIAIGKDADLVILKENPVDHINNLHKMESVIKKGVFIL